MPVFLIGFMAAGKTSVGRELARSTGREFIDVDHVIAAMGEPIASLVTRDEPEFRRREARAIAQVIAAHPDAVIATGGGAAAFGDNLDTMRAAGLVVALGVDVAEAQRRGAGSERPLLAQAAQLAAARAPLYRRAHAVVDTMGRTITEVVAGVAAVERVWRQLPAVHRGATIVSLGDRSYPITVETALDVGHVRAGLAGATRIAVITDPNVARYAAGLGDDVIEVPAGEASKSFAVYEQLCTTLVARGLDRRSAIVALGGGVVGDLAGFVAATLFRGIPVVQVPTTLVAMVDSAVGGKTAIDVAGGKNLVGAFHQPRLVACALDTLATLPPRERCAGFGELWKYALLDGRELWRLVAALAAWAHGAPPPPELRVVIERAIAYKAAIVGRDERELTGHRALLNLGHTVGHAIESESGMLHGEAVALGLIAACRVSSALAGTPPALEAELVEGLAATGLPTDLDRWLTEPVLERLAVDKKRVGGNLHYVLIREVGACEPTDVPVTEVRRILRLVRRA